MGQQHSQATGRPELPKLPKNLDESRDQLREQLRNATKLLPDKHRYRSKSYLENDDDTSIIDMQISGYQNTVQFEISEAKRDILNSKKLQKDGGNSVLSPARVKSYYDDYQSKFSPVKDENEMVDRKLGLLRALFPSEYNVFRRELKSLLEARVIHANFALQTLENQVTNEKKEQEEKSALEVLEAIEASGQYPPDSEMKDLIKRTGLLGKRRSTFIAFQESLQLLQGNLHRKNPLKKVSKPPFNPEEFYPFQLKAGAWLKKMKQDSNNPKLSNLHEATTLLLLDGWGDIYRSQCLAERFRSKVKTYEEENLLPHFSRIKETPIITPPLAGNEIQGLKKMSMTEADFDQLAPPSKEPQHLLFMAAKTAIRARMEHAKAVRHICRARRGDVVEGRSVEERSLILQGRSAPSASGHGR